MKGYSVHVNELNKIRLEHERHRIFQDAYTMGFLDAYKLVREALILKDSLEHKNIKAKFEDYMIQYEGSLQNG